MFFGAPFWGYLSDNYGRRVIIGIASFLIFLFGFLGGFATNFSFLLISRGGVGFSLGSIPVGFTLLLEWLPGSARGRWSTSLSYAWCIGSIVQVCIAWYILPTQGWKILLQVVAIPALVSCIMLFAMVVSSVTISLYLSIYFSLSLSLHPSHTPLSLLF